MRAAAPVVCAREGEEGEIAVKCNMHVIIGRLAAGAWLPETEKMPETGRFSEYRAAKIILGIPCYFHDM